MATEDVPAEARWTTEEDAALKGGPLAVRVLEDGCLHVHGALAFDLCAEFDLPLRDGAHAFPAACVVTEGPKTMQFGGFDIRY